MPAVRSRGRSTYGPEPKPRSDAYTGLLILSLVAQVAGVVFLWLDYSRYPASTPPKVNMQSVAAAPAGGAVPPPQAAPAPVVPPAAPAGNPAAPAGNPVPPAVAPGK